MLRSLVGSEMCIRDRFQDYGYDCLYVPEDRQADLHDTIYNKEWGIKAIFPVTKQARQNFLGFAHYLVKQGAEAIILGCTEIPLALPESMFPGTMVVMVDPVMALARALIREADSSKLKPLVMDEPPESDDEVMSEFSDKAWPSSPGRHHECKEEWLDERALEEGWETFIEGRCTEGPRRTSDLHHLLAQQQQDIRQLKNKIGQLNDTPSTGMRRVKSTGNLSFTHIKKMERLEDISNLKNGIVKGPFVNVVMKQSSPLVEGMSKILARDPLDLSLPAPEIDNEAAAPSSPEKDSADAHVDKYLKILMVLTVFICVLLVVICLLALQFVAQGSSKTSEL
eukprot:TRINITY_DN4723_c0_g1_i8.p1 TRINITY_DN4723_c0_g1~~TRINITY_DN4723_c0_g1_i8.p1  ORF type:complete len:339 (-),score=74.47 TRINITY_DN4723_c0_g1_i8:399-1415(-)